MPRKKKTETTNIKEIEQENVKKVKKILSKRKKAESPTVETAEIDTSTVQEEKPIENDIVNSIIETDVEHKPNEFLVKDIDIETINNSLGITKPEIKQQVQEEIKPDATVEAKIDDKKIKIIYPTSTKSHKKYASRISKRTQRIHQIRNY